MIIIATIILSSSSSSEGRSVLTFESYDLTITIVPHSFCPVYNLAGLSVHRKEEQLK